MKLLLLIPIALLLGTGPDEARAQVPGIVHTESGYDTLGGEDAICWFATPFRNQTVAVAASDGEMPVAEFNGHNWFSPLFPSFVAGPTDMLPSCPLGMDAHMDLLVPPEERLRRDEPYPYHMYASVNLTELRTVYQLTNDAFFTSANGSPQVAARFIFCPFNGNLCSPFRTFQGRRLRTGTYDDPKMSKKTAPRTGSRTKHYQTQCSHEARDRRTLVVVSSE